MGYEYLDQSRASDPTALPDVEVFQQTIVPEDETEVSGEGEGNYGMGEANASWYSGPGFYFAFGSPGCLWDSDPEGPFPSYDFALQMAREDSGFCEHGYFDLDVPGPVLEGKHADVCPECPAPNLWVIVLPGANERFYTPNADGSAGGSWHTVPARCAAWASMEAAETFRAALRGASFSESHVRRLSDAEARAWGR